MRTRGSSYWSAGREGGRGFFFFQAEDGIRDLTVTGVQTCALPICSFTTEAGRSTTSPAAILLMTSPGRTAILDVIEARRAAAWPERPRLTAGTRPPRA